MESINRLNTSNELNDVGIGIKNRYIIMAPISSADITVRECFVKKPPTTNNTARITVAKDK